MPDLRKRSHERRDGRRGIKTVRESQGRSAPQTPYFFFRQLRWNMDSAATSPQPTRRKSSVSTYSSANTITTAPSTVSTPTSAGSPAEIASNPKPSTVPAIGQRVSILPNTGRIVAPAANLATQKHMASVPALTPTSNEARPLSMTTREWVIPPRPKPGRKPATDTPPTKRKAQNRAAQRAFRERRAARVGELEEQLDDQKDEHDRTVKELQDRINHLELESQALHSRCQWLEGQLEQERLIKGTTVGSWVDDQQSPSTGDTNLGPVAVTSSQHALQHTSPPGLAVSSPEAMGASGASPFSIAQIISQSDEINGGAVNIGCGSCSPEGPCACAEEVLANANLTMGCGNCGIGTRCQCLEESFESTATGSRPKRRPASPVPGAFDEKRPRRETGSTLETDFTALFSSGRITANSQSAQATAQPMVMSSVEAKDSCGFCKDGTYCACADALASTSVATLPVAPRQPASQQTHTPPPSESDVVPTPMEVTATGAIKLPRISSLQRARGAGAGAGVRPAQQSSSCGPNGPGTCAQCLSDPKSGLFCRSLAANFERNNRGQQGGCCGQGGPGGCCKSGSATAPAKPNPASQGLSLSCAETYKTLASHRNFDEAADEIGTWLPKLRAVPTPEGSTGHPAPVRLAPIEVEAASIMSVLKEFDVRFGRGE